MDKFKFAMFRPNKPWSSPLYLALLLAAIYLVTIGRSDFGRNVLDRSDSSDLSQLDWSEKKFKLSCQQRFIFVDLGANRADTARVFIKQKNAKFDYDYPRPLGCNYSDAEMFLFEANPLFNEDLVKAKEEFLHNKSVKNIQIFPSTLVWIEDKVMPFYLDTVNHQNDYWGSSILETANDVKRSGNVHVNLTAVDIANFILKNFLPSDFVVVKMDIEGAEQMVVPHLANMKAYINIDHLLVEWHSGNQNIPSVVEACNFLKSKGVVMDGYDSPA